MMHERKGRAPKVMAVKVNSDTDVTIGVPSSDHDSGLDLVEFYLGHGKAARIQRPYADRERTVMAWNERHLRLLSKMYERPLTPAVKAYIRGKAESLGSLLRDAN